MTRRRSDPYKPLNFFVGVGASVFFVGVGLFMLIAMVIPENLRLIRFQDAVRAEVVDISGHMEWDVSGTSELIVEYTYVFDGREYTGSRASVYEGKDNFGSFSGDLFRRLKRDKEAGASISCYVLPEDPEQAVLDRSFRVGRGVVAILLPVLAILGPGALGVWMVCHRERYFAGRS